MVAKIYIIKTSYRKFKNKEKNREEVEIITQTNENSLSKGVTPKPYAHII